MIPDKGPAINSDNLRLIRDLVAEHPGLAKLGRIVQLRFVVDANVVLADLIWLAKVRRDPTARTSLQEVIASGTVVAFAPTVLEYHVRKNFREISEKEAIPQNRLEDLWAEYRSKLSFRDPDGTDTPRPEWGRDPTDIPYVLLQPQVEAAAIYTRDKDIEAMGGPVVTAEVILSLRDYSRAAAVELTLKIGGVVLALGTATAVYFLIRAIVELFMSLPSVVQLLVVVTLVVAILHPRSREFLAAAVEQLGQELRTVLDTVGPIVMELADACAKAEASAQQALGAAQRGLPGPAAG